MPLRQDRRLWRVALLATAGWGALTVAASAKDLPASADGAKTITSFVETYMGKAAAAPPGFTVTQESSDYLVSVDIGAMTAALKSSGISYDPAIFKLKVFQQDDGAWRVEQTDFPAIKAHTTQNDLTMDSVVNVTGLKNTFLIDPAIGWIRSAQGSGDKFSLSVKGSGVDEEAQGSGLQATLATKSAGDGTVSSDVQESLSGFSATVNVDPKAGPKPNPDPNAKPVNFTTQAGPTNVGIKVGALKTKPLLDLWAFLVANPTRADRAAKEPELKTLLTAMLASQSSIEETIGMQKFVVQVAQGPFAFDSMKVGFGGAAAGPASHFEEHFAASGLALPPGLVPPMFADLIPTSFDFGFKVSGFDLTAAGTEAIADMHLAGDGPAISKEDNNKVFAKLIGGGPVTIDIPPSHVLAPHLDVAFEGQIHYQGGKPTGTVTVHVRDFDKTVAALKALGPDTERKMVPVLAMAKGLAKADPDGTLTWVGEVGPDGIMKVNGLPLGKAPF